MDKKTFDEQYRPRLEKLATTNIADALDSLGMNKFAYGVNPMNKEVRKIIGRAVTVKITAAGMTKSKKHMCITSVAESEPGDVIVIDNGGRLDTNCWGGILTAGAKLAGVSGVVIDGACRDVEEYDMNDFPVFARGRVVATARGRLIEEGTNIMIQFQGVQVRPGDIVVADHSGVVFIPIEIADETIAKAEQLMEKEEAMIADMRSGMGILEVDQKYNYERMLQK